MKSAEKQALIEAVRLACARTKCMGCFDKGKPIENTGDMKDWSGGYCSSLLVHKRKGRGKSALYTNCNVEPMWSLEFDL